MDFHFRAAQFFQKPQGVNRSARAGDSDYYSQIASPKKTCFVPKLEQSAFILLKREQTGRYNSTRKVLAWRKPPLSTSRDRIIARKQRDSV